MNIKAVITVVTVAPLLLAATSAVYSLSQLSMKVSNSIPVNQLVVIGVNMRSGVVYLKNLGPGDVGPGELRIFSDGELLYSGHVGKISVGEVFKVTLSETQDPSKPHTITVFGPQGTVTGYLYVP